MLRKLSCFKTSLLALRQSTEFHKNVLTKGEDDFFESDNYFSEEHFLLFSDL